MTEKINQALGHTYLLIELSSVGLIFTSLQNIPGGLFQLFTQFFKIRLLNPVDFPELLRIEAIQNAGNLKLIYP